MTPAEILQSATVLLASSRNASYTPTMAVREAEEMALLIEEAHDRAHAEHVYRGAVLVKDDGNPDCA